MIRAAMNKQGIGDACDDEQIRKFVEQPAAEQPDAGFIELTECFCDLLNGWMLEVHDPAIAPHVPIQKEAYIKGFLSLNWDW